MLPFPVQLELGGVISDQVCHAARLAIIAGKLRPGERFPSISQLSRELRINHNTAHKVVAKLSLEGLLEGRSGIGMFVVAPKPASKQARTQWLGRELEHVLARACLLAIPFDELTAILTKHWKALSGGGKACKNAKMWQRQGIRKTRKKG